jgi:GNAT superfamily N-acetyltransferase
MNTQGPATALFAAADYRAVELGTDDIPALQRFFEINPEYFLTVTGEPPTATEAHEEAQGAPLQGWSFTRKWLIGIVDETDSLVAMADVISDLLAPGVWHIGLMIVATRLHGRGVAQTLYGSLERWMHDSGAQWLRLGVVEGNARAARFWERQAFVEVRKRSGIEMGNRVNTVRVMVKPLRGGTLPEYLALVARDRPDSC